jgi:uncharacterized membrane protein YphA (DoxX/SURF4 family)
MAFFIFLRIALGIILVWKGLNFLRDTAAVTALLGNNVAVELAKVDTVLIVILSVITLLCGLFILIGRYTRPASFVALPAFLIKTLFIHGGYIERYGFELILTIIVPFLLLIFIAKGNFGLREKGENIPASPGQ